MTIVLPIDTGGPLKRDLVEGAYEKAGSAGYEFARTPEEIASAVRNLNTMMAESPWDQLGYYRPTNGQGSAEEESGIPDFAQSAVTMELALRIAPGMGAALSPDATKAHALARENLIARLATVPVMPRLQPNVPGQGNRRYRRFRTG